jgi:Domain of unknown function (DUF4340)
MNSRRLIVAVVVLSVLIGMLYWSQHRKPSDEDAATSASTAAAILKLEQSSITQVRISKKGAEPITLTNNSNQWRITQPKSLNADQSTVSNLLSSLASLNADRVVEDKASDVKQYGFDQPAIEVEIAEKDGKRQKLLLGDDTPAGGDVYTMLDGNPRVFAIASYTKTSLDKGLNDLRDKRLITIDPDKVNHVEFQKKTWDIEFARSKDGWEILKPNSLRVDSFAIDDFVRTLANGRMEMNETGADAAEKFAHAAPVATAKLTGDKGEQKLDVRKDKDEYYAKSSVVEGAYRVDSALGQAFEKNLDDFRNRKLFDFSFQDPNKIELHNDTKTWVFTHSGTDWWSNGKKMDASSIESLLAKLRALTADRFADAGFMHSEIEAIVTSNDGKRVEKVQIAKSGDSYIAKRENEPSLYQLNSTVVDDLVNAAKEVKPASPPISK